MNYPDFKSVIVLFFFFIPVFSSVHGQDLEPFLDGKPKHTLGVSGTFNPRFVFERSPGLPVDIIYRRFNSNNQAFRARIGGAYSKISEESGIYYDREWNSNLGLGLGYEWHHEINDRFSWYYGGELGVTYYWLDQNQARSWIVQGIPVVRKNFTTKRTSEFTCKGLVGVNFQLNSRFLLTLEQSVFLSRQDYESSDVGELVPIDPSVEITLSSGSGSLSAIYTRALFQTSLGIQINIF
ncbi:hypothetical protein [Algoriphagus namhaensis]